MLTNEYRNIKGVDISVDSGWRQDLPSSQHQPLTQEGRSVTTNILQSVIYCKSHCLRQAELFFLFQGNFFLTKFDDSFWIIMYMLEAKCLILGYLSNWHFRLFTTLEQNKNQGFSFCSMFTTAPRIYLIIDVKYKCPKKEIYVISYCIYFSKTILSRRLNFKIRSDRIKQRI